MNQDFVFSQLVQAYRRGIISEAAFEREMAEVERGAGANGGGFSANGQSYTSSEDTGTDFAVRLPRRSPY
jgi:hypothetical protein